MKLWLMLGVSVLAVSAGSASASVVFNYSGLIQEWTAPKTGDYVIDPYGAQGGDFYEDGGYGVGLEGEFYLTVGETLAIAVGGQGQIGAGTGGGGGGGS